MVFGVLKDQLCRLVLTQPPIREIHKGKTQGKWFMSAILDGADDVELGLRLVFSPLPQLSTCNATTQLQPELGGGTISDLLGPHCVTTNSLTYGMAVQSATKEHGIVGTAAVDYHPEEGHLEGVGAPASTFHLTPHKLAHQMTRDQS